MAGKTPHLMRAGGAHWRVLAAIGALYVGFGVMVAILQGGLPPILRARGLSMNQITWTFALYLPLGLSFLWAPWVDRVRLPFLSRRIGWIVAAQVTAVSAVIAVALMPAAALPVLFGVGLVIALATATMDLALDALAVEVTGEKLKPIAASLKLAALASGSFLGSGVFIGLLDQIGWQSTFLLVAVFLAMATLPVLGLVKIDHDHGKNHAIQHQWLFSVLRERQLRGYLVMLLAAAASIFPLTALNRVMLVDLGVPLAHVAWIVGTLQPLGLLLVSLVTAPLIRGIGHRGALMLLTVAGLACVALMMAAYHAKAPTLAIAGTVGIATVVGGLMVVYASLILSWSAGEQAATRYAVLFCGTRLSGIIATVLAGRLAGWLGWQLFYGVGMVAMLCSALWLLSGLRAHHPEQEAVSDLATPS